MMQNPHIDQWQQELNHQIPVSLALGVKIKTLDELKVELWAPFKKNVNHKQTVFGGSLQAVAILSAWLLIRYNLSQISAFKYCEVVITKSHADFHLGVSDNFIATCCRPDQVLWNKFLNTLTRRKKARICVGATIFHLENPLFEFKGTFAALKTN